MDLGSVHTGGKPRQWDVLIPDPLLVAGIDLTKAMGQ